MGNSQAQVELQRDVVEKEVHPFELERYASRMARYLGTERTASAVFFEALDFAYQLHAGHTRKSGAPYISHPCAVAEILLRELKLRDPTLLAGALLHDLVEDIPGITLPDIEERFGTVVAELVDGCTKLTRYQMDRSTLKDLTHSKIFLSASRRLGVLIIKLTDRLHNLRTLHYLKQPQRQRIAQETIEVYAPIAAILNIATLKRELYDLALSHLYPRKTKKILNVTRGLLNSPEVLEIEETLRGAFAGKHLGVTVRPRVKGLGSYYDHLKRSMSLVNAENRIDIAIIVGSEDIYSCYTCLGIVNNLFPPIPRTLRDFIASPKANGYQSLHARANIKGQNYLFKTRTPQMDRRATYGILSDWGVQKQLSDDHWQEISELLRSIGEYAGAGRQRKALIRLSEAEDVFAYTPLGDIHYFPKGSTVLDFAYKIHSELGEYCCGALLNEMRVGPAHALHDGDVVQIITSTAPLDVDPALEELCKTPKARTALNRQMQQKRLRYAQEIGRQILLQEIQRHRLDADLLEGEHTRLVMEVLNLRELTDLYAQIGQDQLSPHLFLYYFIGDAPRQPPPALKEAAGLALPMEQNELQLGELDSVIHKFSRCCSPYPGQPRTLAVLSERGVSIHQRNCPELRRHGMAPQDLLQVAWQAEPPWRRPLFFHINLQQETIASLLPTLAGLPENLHIEEMRHGVDSYGESSVQMTVRFTSLVQVKKLFEALPKVISSIEWYGRHDWWKRTAL